MNNRDNYCLFEYNPIQGCFNVEMLPSNKRQSHGWETLIPRIKHTTVMNFILWFHIQYPVLLKPRSFSQVLSDLQNFLNNSE